MSCLACRALQFLAWPVLMLIAITAFVCAAVITLVALPFILLLKR